MKNNDNTKPRLSIVIGALREEKRIGKTLDELSIFLKKVGLDKTTEVVIVVPDGGDRTLEIVESFLPAPNSKHSSHDLQPPATISNLRIIRPGAPVGKGRDIREGMLATKGSIRLFMDADLATPLSHILTLLSMFENEKPDIIIGTRRLSAMHKSHLRRFVSVVGNMCFLVVGGFYSPDTQCGFKAFTSESAELCFGKLTRMKWSFDMELLTIAHVNKLEVQQIHISDWQDVPNGSFNPNLRNSWQFFKDLARILSYRLNGRYLDK